MKNIGNSRRDYAAEWKRWRRSRGWTQKELADVLGVSLRTVASVENRHHPPCLSTRQKMGELQERHREARELESYGNVTDNSAAIVR